MYKVILLFLLLFPVMVRAQEPKPLILKDHEDSHDLTPFLEVLSDVPDSLTIDEILSRGYDAQELGFHPMMIKKPDYQATTHWVRFRLINQSPGDEEFKISIAFTDSIEFYIPYPNRSYTLKKTGDLFGIEDRDVQVGEMVFVKFMLPKDKAQTFYLRLKSDSHISQDFKKLALHSFKLYSDRSFEDRFELPRRYQAFFYGALLIMAIYNLFIFFSLRSISYLYYVLYILSVLVFLSSNGGYLVEVLLPNAPRTDLMIRFFSTPVVIVCYLLFSRSFLNVSQYATRFDKYIKILLGLFAVPPLLMIAGFWPLGRTVVIVMAIFSFVLILVVAIYCQRKGFSPARFFILANVLLLLGAVVYATTRLLVVVQHPFTKYSLQISLLLEVSLFSLGLADRINLMRRQITEQALEKERLGKAQETERKKLIEEQNRQLEIKVAERTFEVVQQKEEIEKKNKNITDSIQYAQRIQRAILGSTDEIIGSFKDAFVLFSPKDIVSGDFYWFSHIMQPQEDTYPLRSESVSYLRQAVADVRTHEVDPSLIGVSHGLPLLPDSRRLITDTEENTLPPGIPVGVPSGKIIIASDCTGHGVPGAFMTVMGCALLDEIINEMQIVQPDQILYALDKKILYNMQKQTGNHKIKDGMDIAIMRIDEKNGKLYFAGAKNPLWYIRDGELHEIKGSRFPIGDGALDHEKVYDLHVIDMKPGDTYYIFSDGFQDQFHEVTKEKYMKKKFKKVLVEINAWPMAAQRDHLENELKQWRGSRHQTDDVLVIGIRV